MSQFVFLFILIGCTDNVRVLLDIPDAESYSNVYIPQATNSPMVKTIYVADMYQDVMVNAYLGGVKSATDDILVEFSTRNDLVEEFNKENGTNYLHLPEQCLNSDQLSARILKGENCSDLVRFPIDGRFLTITRSYLLPITASCSDGNLLESKSVAYYVLVASYPPGEDPRDLVYSFGRKITGTLFAKEQDIIYRDDSNGSNLYRYVADDNGQYSFDRVVGWGWINFEPIFYIPPYDFVFKLGDTFQQFAVTGDYQWGAGAFIHRYGWSNIEKAFPFKDKAVLAINGESLRLFNVVHHDDLNWVTFKETEEEGGIILSESGWGDCKHVFCYKNYIVSISYDGELFVSTLTDDLEIGEKEYIESGWDIYDKVFPCGDNIYAVDATGDMYRMPFSF